MHRGGIKMSARNVWFINENNGKENIETVAKPTTGEECEHFNNWLHSHYPEYTTAEYIIGDGISYDLEDYVRVRICDLKTKEEKIVTRIDD
jgi:hypothetical protein